MKSETKWRVKDFHETDPFMSNAMLREAFSEDFARLADRKSDSSTDESTSSGYSDSPYTDLGKLTNNNVRLVWTHFVITNGLKDGGKHALVVNNWLTERKSY